MGTGQMFLTLGGMFLLSLLIVRTNNTFLTTGDVMYNTKFGVLAISLGTSMIEEASSKAFDATTDTMNVTSLNTLTAPSGLGPASGETHDMFNDFDDYNNYIKIDTSMPAATFKVSCKVGYVEPTAPNNFVNYRTWHKKIVVTVTSPSMDDTIRVAQVYSYWFFR